MGKIMTSLENPRRKTSLILALVLKVEIMEIKSYPH